MMKQVSLAERKQGFRIHAIVFVLSLALMTAINIATGAPYWIGWVVLGWGLGIAGHWLIAFGPGADTAGNS